MGSLKKRAKLNKELVGNSDQNICSKFFLSSFLMLSSMLTPILISIPLHDSRLFREIETLKVPCQFELCFHYNEYDMCNDQVYGVSIYLIILFVIAVAPALLFIYYAIELRQIYYLRHKKRSQ